MSVSTRVDPGESGRLRLYTIEAGTHDGAALRDALKGATTEAGPLAAQALGASGIDPYWLTLVPVADVNSIGFATYLRAGYDVPDAQLNAARDSLNAATGTVLIVQSPAFAGAAQALHPAAFLTPLAEFDTVRAPAATSMTQPAPVRAPTPHTDDGTPPRRSLPPAAALVLLLAAGLIILLVSLAGGG
jgi:hypothetical protein